MTNTRHFFKKMLRIAVPLLAVLITCMMGLCVYAETASEECTHNYEASATVAPKCTKGGYTVYTCTLCGDDYKDDFTDPTPHLYDNDCDTECNVCKATRVTAHVYDDGCDKDCNVCGEKRTAPHNYTATATVAPKCYKGGYTVYTCADCNDTYKADLTDPIPHLYTNDCDTECNVCKATREITHTYSDVCDPTCNVCKAERDVHNYSATATAEPKCYKGGYTVYTCADCGDTYKADFTDPVPHLYTNDCDTDCNICKATRETEHVYDNGCDPDCNVCKEERETQHKYKATATVAPKCDKVGYTVYVCEICGSDYKGDEKEATGHTYSSVCDNQCDVCGDPRGDVTHTYDNACDETCNVCGNVRTITHDYGKNGKCTVCGASETESNATVIVVVIIIAVVVLGVVTLVVRNVVLKKKKS